MSTFVIYIAYFKSQAMLFLSIGFSVYDFLTFCDEIVWNILVLVTFVSSIFGPSFKSVKR